MQTVTLAMLGQGQLFGDIDFVFQRCYTYQLRVIENDSQVYLVKSKDFEKVLKMHKETWRMVEKSAIERNQALLEKFSQQFMMRWRQSEQTKKIVHQQRQSPLKEKDRQNSVEKEIQKMAAGFESPQKSYQQKSIQNQQLSHREESTRLEVKTTILRNNQSAASIPTAQSSSKKGGMNMEIQDQSGQQS